MDTAKIIGVIASTLHLDATELTAALKDGENWISDEEFADKVRETITGQVKAAKDAQLKRGTRESWTAVEKWIKAQGFAPDGELKGTDLLDAFTDHLKAQAPEGGKPGEMAKDELAKLPAVKALINEGKAEVGKRFETLQTDFDNYKKQSAKAQVSEVVKRRLTEFLEEGKVLLEVQGSNVSKTQRIEAVSKFLNFDEIGLNEKGDPIFVDAENQPKTDDYGKPVDFKKHVIGIGEQIFGIQKQDPGKGGANPPQGGGTQGGGDYKPTYSFASQAEYDKQKLSEPDAAKRAQMAKDYFFHQQQK